jgi:hypothetical protein
MGAEDFDPAHYNLHAAHRDRLLSEPEDDEDYGVIEDEGRDPLTGVRIRPLHAEGEDW